jgi:hypothetical protein
VKPSEWRAEHSREELSPDPDFPTAPRWNDRRAVALLWKYLDEHHEKAVASVGGGQRKTLTVPPGQAEELTLEINGETLTVSEWLRGARLLSPGLLADIRQCAVVALGLGLFSTREAAGRVFATLQLLPPELGPTPALDGKLCVYQVGEDDDGNPTGPACGKPATCFSCAPFQNAPTCAAHKCRCRPVGVRA